MKKNKLKPILILLGLSLASFLSCTDNQSDQVHGEASNLAEKEKLPAQDTIQVTLNSNDKMQFDKSEINVFESQTVVLTLTHTGTMPIAAMGHNFVLLTMGASIPEFAQLATMAKDNDYIPTDESSIIAHTQLIGGGESATITFKAPEKGVYHFLCSFPGHYSIMKGKFNVL